MNSFLDLAGSRQAVFVSSGVRELRTELFLNSREDKKKRLPRGSLFVLR